MGQPLRAALLGLAVVAIGCGGNDATSTEQRVPGPTDTLVVYARSGGFVGVRERLAVRPDGAARVESGGRARRVQLTPAELVAVRDAVNGVDAAGLDRRYAPAGGVADAFTTTVTIDGRTVEVVSGGESPATLSRLTNLCERLVARYAPR